METIKLQLTREILKLQLGHKHFLTHPGKSLMPTLKRPAES